MKKSQATEIGPVTFPEFTAERIYMVPFLQRDGLPEHLQRWQPTVDAMMDGIETGEPVFIMIDQSIMKAGNTQRRPGVHIDGIWISDDWDVETGWKTDPGNIQKMGTHDTGRHQTTPPKEPRKPQSIILASNVEGCAAYAGDWDGEIGEGGDASRLDLSRLQKRILNPFTAFSGDAMTLLHESIPVKHACQRTLVRLNVTH